MQFSLSVADKIRALKVGFFSNMINGSTVLSDTTNTASNILAAAGGTVACQLQSASLQYYPMIPIFQIVLQVGSVQRVINTQQLQLLHKIPASSKPFKHTTNPFWQALQSPLVLDLTPYTDMLQSEEGGAMSGGSTSLLVQILISP